MGEGVDSYMRCKLLVKYFLKPAEWVMCSFVEVFPSILVSILITWLLYTMWCHFLKFQLSWDSEGGAWGWDSVRRCCVNVSLYLVVVVVCLLCVLTGRVRFWCIFAALFLLQRHGHEERQSLITVHRLRPCNLRRHILFAHWFVGAVVSRLVIGCWRVCVVRTGLLRDAEGERAAGGAETRLTLRLSQSTGDINGFIRSSASLTESRSWFSRHPSAAHARLLMHAPVCITAALVHRQPATRRDRE